AARRVVEDDRLEVGSLEVHVRAGVLRLEGARADVVAASFVHREARLALACRIDVAVSGGCAARRCRPILNGRLEVVATDAVDLERNRSEEHTSELQSRFD